MKLAFAFVLACAAGPARAASTPAKDQPLDAPVAIVFRTAIWQSELDERVSHLPEPHDASNVDRALDELIDDTLVELAAKDLAIAVEEADIDAAITAIKQNNHLDDAGLAKALTDQHYTMAQWRLALRLQILNARFVQRVFASQLPSGGDTDAKVRALGAAREDWLRTRRRVAHLDKHQPVALAHPAGALAAVDVRHPDRVVADQIRGLFSAQIGKPIDAYRVRSALATALVMPNVADVVAVAKVGPKSWTLSITASAQPKVHAITMREAGGKDMALSPVLAALVGQALDPVRLDAAVGELSEYYIEHGYASAQADWRTTRAGAQVNVAVELSPGEQTVIEGIELHGASKAHQAALVKIGEQDFPHGTPFRADVAARSELLLAVYYYDHGYVNVHVQLTPPKTGHVHLVFEVKEGDQFRLGGIDVKGLPPADAKRELATLVRRLKRGDVFARNVVADEINALSKRVGKEVLPLTQIDVQHKTVDVTFEVQP